MLSESSLLHFSVHLTHTHTHLAGRSQEVPSKNQLTRSQMSHHINTEEFSKMFSAEKNKVSLL